MSLFYFFCVNIGKNMKIPIMDIIKPPIVSAANGNQKASYYERNESSTSAIR